MLERALQLQQAGRLAEAAEEYRRALAEQPLWPEAHNNLGYVYRQMGDLGSAIASYRRAAQLRPDFAEAIGNLGEALALAGRIDEAINAMQQAMNLRPDLAELHCNLGSAYCQRGQWDLALAALARAVELRPDFAPAYNNLGNAHNGLGNLDQAAAHYRRAIALEPRAAQFHNNLAVTLRDARTFEESVVSARRALELQPDYPEAHSNLGSALACVGDLEGAERAYRRALELRPNFLEPYTNMGHLFFISGQWDQAAAVYRDVLRRQNDDAQAHWSLGFILLLKGDYPNGWPEYEWRWRVRELRMQSPLKTPVWDGDDLRGRTILIRHEQGFGDTIQFVRYLPQVAARGGRVILSCQDELISLIRNCAGIDQCVSSKAPPPAHEVWCPLLSLPRLMKTTVATIPARAPYLQADAEKIEKWRQRLSGQSAMKIGLAWAGRASHPNDRNRSISLAALAPLLNRPGCRFVSLQKEDSQREARAKGLIDWTDELTDFSDTAALVANLDLVITVDSAVAHLAAAMGKAVWVLLPFAPDWRWMLDREDSPWYPTMRLFRQTARGEWTGVIEKLAEALERSSP